MGAPTSRAEQSLSELVAPIFNPASFSHREKIDGIFAALRRDHPLACVEVPGYDPHWMVTKYSDVKEITRQDELFHSGDRPKILHSQAGEALARSFTGGSPTLFQSLVQLDPPEHTAYRNVLQGEFMPGGIAKMKENVTKTALEFVDQMASLAPACDFADDVAMNYPLQVVLDIVGVPREHHAKMLQLTQWLFSYADPDLKRPGSDITDPEEIIKTWNVVFTQFHDFFMPLVEARRANPKEDIASLIANAKINGESMEERKMISYFGILATAGHDTTSATTALGMKMLAENPDMLARLREKPDLVPSFVEECIRWGSPVQHFIRSATEDYVLRDQTIRKGDLLYISYLSANRDEEEFEDPFTFKLDRAPNRHVGFGFGGHVCLGQHLARLEIRTFWQTLLPRLKQVELTGPVQFTESEFVCGPKSVPIRFEMT